MRFGYERVSSKDQHLELQRKALERDGCEKFFTDKISSVKERPGLDACLRHLRKGDTLVVWKLDRLGRSLKQLMHLIEQFERDGIEFKSLTENIDTTTPAGRFFLHMMGAFAQMERELIRERTMAGLEAASALGRHGGRKRKMTESKVNSARTLLASGQSMHEVAKNFGVSLATLYRHIPANPQEDEVEAFVEL
jgi:DNA invertase Pin-like site-specific DNA recombinase